MTVEYEIKFFTRSAIKLILSLQIAGYGNCSILPAVAFKVGYKILIRLNPIIEFIKPNIKNKSSSLEVNRESPA